MWDTLAREPPTRAARGRLRLGRTLAKSSTACPWDASNTPYGGRWVSIYRTSWMYGVLRSLAGRKSYSALA
jgi:hypothetical protein